MIAVTRHGDIQAAEIIGVDAAMEIKSIAGDKFSEYGDAFIAVQQAALAVKATNV